MEIITIHPETHEERTETHAHDYISRQGAIDEIKSVYEWHDVVTQDRLIEHLRQLPSAQPEVKPISYMDCANAMLRMWMDNVVTDGEYSRIMDRLNEKYDRGGGT